MRALGGEYDALMASAIAPSLWRVLAAGHGIGGQPDPFDLTPYVSGVAVNRPGRGQPNSGTLVLDNGGGEFDTEAGVLAAIVAPNNAEIQVSMGTRLAAGPTYWRVMTAGVLESETPYDAASSQVSVALGDRGRNIARLSVTSELFEDTDAVDLIKALFVEFAGFTDPADFNLGVLGHNIRVAQFESEPIMTAAGACVLPLGKALSFDYDGRLIHADLTPAGWGAVLTIRKVAIESLSTGRRPPQGTRILVAAGPDYERPLVGEPEVWASSRYAWNHDTGVNSLGGGDCYDYIIAREAFPPAMEDFYAAHYHMAGQKGRLYRVGYSRIANIVYDHPAVGEGSYDPLIPGFSNWVTPPKVTAEYWSLEHDRQHIDVFWDTGRLDATLNIDFTFDILGHPLVQAAPNCDVQTWDDALIAAYGEIPRTISAPLAQTYDEATQVGADELLRIQGAAQEIHVVLRELDLRVEAGDVIAIENELGGTVTCWVQAVKHGAGSNSQTVIDGIGVP